MVYIFLFRKTNLPISALDTFGNFDTDYAMDAFV